MRYVRAEFEEPHSCLDCPCVYIGIKYWYCNLEEELRKISSDHSKRPSWCKLKVVED